VSVPRPTIPLFEPRIKGNEWKYVKDCLDTNWISSVGAYVSRFEETMARHVGKKHAVATVNGTAALHMALIVSGVGRGDEVIMPSITFIAPANAVRYVGAHPVFMDAEPRFFQIDVAKTLEFLEKGCRWTRGELRNKATGRRVRALMPVDVLGHPADVKPLIAAARKYDLRFIEDASESLGSSYRGAATARSAELSCFSFNGNKLVTTGGGGMLLTDNDEWAARARHLTTQAKRDPIEYIHSEVGYNYRLTNVLAAIGLGQLEKLAPYVKLKRKLADRYHAGLAGVPGLTVMREAAWAHSTFWMYTVLIDEKRYGMDSRALLRRLSEKKIMTRPLWQPMHMSPAHAGAQAYRCETAVKIYREALSIPSSVGLGAREQSEVIRALRKSS
jgi:perosamine synthetase